MNKLFLGILTAVLLYAGTAQAMWPTFSYMTFPKFSVQEMWAQLKKQIVESVENISLDQFLTWGSEGNSGMFAQPVDSGLQGVALTMPKASWLNEEIGVTADDVKESTEKAADLIQKTVQIPTPEKQKEMTSAAIAEQTKKVAQVQTDVTKEAIAVAVSNVQLSSEQQSRQTQMEETIKSAVDLRGDVQARAVATLSILGEMNRLLGISTKYLEMEAAHALTHARSSTVEAEEVES